MASTGFKAQASDTQLKVVRGVTEEQLEELSQKVHAQAHRIRDRMQLGLVSSP
jgi:hypothetical protein